MKMRLLYVEFALNPEDLSVTNPVESTSEPVILEVITKVISKMASDKEANYQKEAKVPFGSSYSYA